MRSSVMRSTSTSDTRLAHATLAAAFAKSQSLKSIFSEKLLEASDTQPSNVVLLHTASLAKEAEASADI